MPLYLNQFSEEHDFPRVETASKILIIASTPRCGSHMLGHALHQTGRFGFPLEYAKPMNLCEWSKRFGVSDFEGVLHAIQQRRTSPNGVFGIKIHYTHLKQFGGFARLNHFLPNPYCVLLSRRDVLAQAVSHAIASQTGIWIAGQQAVTDEPKYDFEQIDRCLRAAILQTASWRYTLAASGAKYIEMDFDQVRGDLVGSIERIARFMGVEIDALDIPQQHVTQRQGNDRNAEWAARFKAEFNTSRELVNTQASSLKKMLKAEVKRMLRC